MSALGESLGEDFGRRDGPCVIVYRDFTWNGHPTYRAHSCLGCAHLVRDDLDQSFCGHPSFLREYGCAQYLGGNYQHRDKAQCHSLSCPALKARGENQWPEQREAARIERGPEYRQRDGFDPFKHVPAHARTAFLFRRAS